MEITKEPYWQAVTPHDPRFARPESLVAGYVLTDFLRGGEEDCAPVIQALLDRLQEAEMVNFSPRQLPRAVFLVEGGTLAVTNLNGSGNNKTRQTFYVCRVFC